MSDKTKKPENKNVSVIVYFMFMLFSFIVCSITINQIDGAYCFGQHPSREYWNAIIFPRDNLTTQLAWIYTISVGFIESYFVAICKEIRLLISAVIATIINILLSVLIYIFVTFLVNTVSWFGENWWFIAFCLFLLSGLGSGELIAVIIDSAGNILARIFRLNH